MNPLTISQWNMFWAGKIVHCLFRYIVPYFYMPFWNLVGELMVLASYNYIIAGFSELALKKKKYPAAVYNILYCIGSIIMIIASFVSHIST